VDIFSERPACRAGDEETGLYYYGARYYDAQTSVWLSVDPLAEKFSGWSSYNYVTNNPLNVVDPNGADTLLINGTSGKVLDTRVGGEDVVFWTRDKEVNDDTWGNSEQLYHALNISGKSGGTKSRKGNPVIWSRQKNKTDDFNKLLDKSVDIWENYKNIFDNEDFMVPGNEFIEKSKFFKSKVDDNAPFDIKNGSYHPKYIGEWSWYEGRLVRYDDYGNMLYGAIGSAFGFGGTYLQLGANINQLGKSGLDEGRDTYSIEVGINKYKQ